VDVSPLRRLRQQAVMSQQLLADEMRGSAGHDLETRDRAAPSLPDGLLAICVAWIVG
jgi:hypothetical protein